MKQQGVHPEGAAGTPDAAARPDTAGGAQDDGPRALENSADGSARARENSAADGNDDTEGAHVPENTPPGHGPGADDDPHAEAVEGDEPQLPARVHRPSDLMRLLVGVLAIVVLL